jgi:hypothetical protein
MSAPSPGPKTAACGRRSAVIEGLALVLFLCGGGVGTAGEFRALVSWDCRDGKKLEPWLGTARLLEAQFGEAGWEVHGIVENPGAEGVRDFFDGAGESAGGVQVVYVAAHQERGGAWRLADGTFLEWTGLLRSGAVRAGWRVLVVDACHAAAVEKAVFPWCDVLIASCEAGEPAREVRLMPRRPVDLRRRDPETWQWAAARTGPMREPAVSFLGWVWAEAARGVECRRMQAADWGPLARALQTAGERLRDGRGRSLSSTIVVRSRTGGVPRGE